MDIPITQYVERPWGTLAYQAFGEGPPDVLWLYEINMHLDLLWTDPELHSMFERHARRCRVFAMQPRGVGLSSPAREFPSLEEQADDVVAVMDAVGMKRGVLAGVLTGCPALALLSARAPERVSHLVFINPPPQGPRAFDWEDLAGYDTDEQRQAVIDGYAEAVAKWGSGDSIQVWDRNQDTPHNRRLMALLERCSSTPAVADAYVQATMSSDYRDAYRNARTPTLVLRVDGSVLPEASIRHTAELMPNATYEVLPQAPPGSSSGEAWGKVIERVEEVATGASRPVAEDRVLSAVLFTDICESTRLLSEIGDSAYRELLREHERRVRKEIDGSNGRLVKVMGDGTFSTFSGPAAAVRCAAAICRAGEDLGVSIRAGVHAGEVELIGADVAGITVHVGARVAAEAGPGQVVVSRTVRDLVGGSGLGFTELGERELKGVPDRWAIYALDQGDRDPIRIPQEPSLQTAADRAVLAVSRRAPGLARAAVATGNAWQRRMAERRVKRGT